MKVDLHVHSKYSIRPSQWVLQKLGCPESFTEPETLYRIARNKGMDMVTITDHNTISGALEIAHLDGTFISEEITTYFPEDGCKAHVLAYDIDEKIHADIQKVRENIYDLVKYLGEAGIIHILAHPLYSVNDKLSLSHLEKFILLFKNFELNGARDEYQNQTVRLIVENLTPEFVGDLIEKHRITPAFPEPWHKNLTGGSDDHSSLNIARQYTEVKFVKDLEEFLLGVETHQAEVAGKASSPVVLSHNLYGIAYQFYKRKFKFEKSVNRDLVLRFLERCLQSDPEEATGLVSRVLYSLRKNRTPRQQEGAKVEDMLRFEANKLLQGDPVLMDIVKNGNGNLENRAERWFHFVNQVSNKVLLHFWNSLLGHLSGANFFNIFQSLGSAGALATVLAPYFVTFTVFSRDRAFSRSALSHFNPTTSDLGDGRSVKMAHFTDTFYEINGVALTLQHQLKLARNSGKDLTVITCDAEKRPSIEGVLNFEPIGVFEFAEYPEQKLFLTPFLEMLNYCYENQFTQIHTATPGPLGLAALAIGKFLKIPVSGTYHTAIPQYAHRLTGDGAIEDLVWKYIIWFYDQLDFILVPSNSTGDELIGKGINPEKIRLFPRGVDTQKFNPSKRNTARLSGSVGAAQGLKILYVGRISKEKDLLLLGHAFKSLIKKVENVELILVGDGPYLNELKEFMDGTPCIFTGYKEGEELSGIYASCDVFAFPSATDTFGNVILEAQASGLPVIVTDSGGPQENVIPNKTGLIVKAGDAESLLHAIETLLSDAALRKKMGVAARRYMENRSYEKAFEQTWGMYQGDSAPTESEPILVAETNKRKAA
ncbi:MAG: glycosyltransferase [Syntrophobacteraceae bacterium]